MIKILITGLNGFLGSYIAQNLINISDIEIIGLKRSSSNLWRCDDYKNQNKWIDIDNENWKEAVINNSPNIIIHSAWTGVAAGDRLDWKSQLQNLDLLIDLLEIAKTTKCFKFIGLGSQAEYGTFSCKISETAIAKPNTAYGTVKLMACNLVESFCSENNIDWFWLRLFPLFGPKEDLQWLLPSVMKTIFDGNDMQLTPGLQRYAYLYVEDFSALVSRIVITSKQNLSGIYNISATNTISLKELVEKIGNTINPQVKLNFGALPYRHYQSMHIEGDMTKYHNAFGETNFSDLDEKIKITIDYYLLKFIKNGN